MTEEDAFFRAVEKNHVLGKSVASFHASKDSFFGQFKMISWFCYVLTLHGWLLSVLTFKSAEQMSYHTGCLFMHMSCFYGVLENDLQKPLRVSGDKSLPEYSFCYITWWRHFPPSGTKKM